MVFGERKNKTSEMFPSHGYLNLLGHPAQIRRMYASLLSFFLSYT